MASATDVFARASSGTRPTPTTLTATLAAGASPGTASCNALTGWPTTSKAHFCIYTIDTNGNKTSGSQTDWVGVVSGTTITGLTLKAGTNTGYPVGAVVEASPIAAYADDLYVGLTAGHNPTDGTHKAFTESNIIPPAAIQSSAITTAKINNGAVTADKLGTGAIVIRVATSQTTTSTSFVDLATVQSVTVTVGANGILLVAVAGWMSLDVGGNQGLISYAISGASTVAASDAESIWYQAYSGGAQHQCANVFLVSGLTPGSTTVTMKFRVTGGTGTFKNRALSVVPL